MKTNVICSFCKHSLNENKCSVLGKQVSKPEKCKYFELNEGKITDKSKLIPFFEASKLARFLNLVIDLLVLTIIAIAFLIFILTFLPEYKSKDLQLLWYAIFVVSFILYYTFTEGFTGKTIGKFITKTKVITMEGKEINLIKSLWRTLLRFIPFEAFSYLFNVNLHDNLSGTTVVYRGFPTEKKQSRKISILVLFGSLVVFFIVFLGYQKGLGQNNIPYKGYLKDSIYINEKYGIEYFIPNGFKIDTIEDRHIIFAISNENSNLIFSVYFRANHPKLKNHSDFLFFINKELKRSTEKRGLKIQAVNEGWINLGGSQFKYLQYKILDFPTAILVEFAGMREDIFLNIDLFSTDSTNYEILIRSLKKAKFRGYIW